MPCEKHKTRHVFAFVAPYSAENALFCPKRPLPAPQKGSEEGVYLYFFRKTYAISPQVHDFYPTSIGIFVVALSLPDLTS